MTDAAGLEPAPAPNGAVLVLATAAAYFLGGKAALLLAIPPGFASPFWPAAGLAAGAALLGGAPALAGVWLGSFAVNLHPADAAFRPFLAAAMLATGATLQAGFAAALARRLEAWPSPLLRADNILSFLAAVGPIACLVNASIGVLSLALMDVITPAEAPFSWWTWWTGDTIGSVLATPLVLVWCARPAAPWKERRPALTVGLLTAMAFGATLFLISSTAERRLLEEEFGRLSDRIARRLSDRVQDILKDGQGLKAFYDASNSVDPSEFKAYTDHVVNFEEAIKALSWAPLEGKRLPVRLIAPLKGNEKALGFDLASEPVRRTAIERARDTGGPAASARLTLVQETGNQAGILFLYPLFRPERSPRTVDERRRNFAGVVSAVLRMGEFVREATRPIPMPSVRVALLDRSAADEASGTLYGNPLGAGSTWLPPFKRNLAVAGRRWEIRIIPASDLHALNRTWKSWAALHSGTLFGALIGVLVLILAGRTSEVEAEVEERTASLRTALEDLRQSRSRLRAQHAATKVLAEGRLEAESVSAVLGAIGTNLRLESGVFWRPSKDGSVLECTAFWSSSPLRGGDFEKRSRAITFSSGVGLPGRVWSSGKAAWIPDVQRDGNFSRAPAAAAAGLHAAFAFPVRTSDSFFGVMEFFSSAPQEPDPALLEMVESVGSLFGPYIERRRAEEARRQAEKEMAAARDAALELAHLKSDFLANMSHEIRTPMNAVIGMSQLLGDTDLDAKQRDYARTISEAGEALMDIINDILDFSKLESGKVELEPADFEARPFFEGVMKMVSLRAQAKGLTLAFEPAPSLPSHLRADSGRLRQVLLNLLSNAVKFTEKGTVALRASAAPAERGRVALTAAVADSGIGIPDAARGRLFQAFSQADSSMTRRFGGTGLGLSISKQLVELMGGTIGFESEHGKGTTFSFTVPLEPASGRPAPPQAAPRNLDPGAVGRRKEAGLRVLLVEDNPVNRKIASVQLTQLGFVPEPVESGAEALAALKRGTEYHAVLMDLHMPEMDGVEATAAVRRLDLAGARVPIIAMTANAFEEDRRRCLAAGMDDFVAKPVRMEDLAAVFERLEARET